MSNSILLEDGSVLLQEDGVSDFTLESGRGQEFNAASGTAVAAIAVALVGAAIATASGVMVGNNSNGSNITASINGSEITSGQGSVVWSSSMAATGSAITSAAGTAVANNRPTTFVSSAISTGQGTLTVQGFNVTVNISGVEATFSRGSVGTTNVLNGTAITMSTGTMAPVCAQPLVGTEFTAAGGLILPELGVDDTLIISDVGVPVALFAMPLVGIGVTCSAGTVAITGDVTQALVGLESATDTGTITGDPFRDLSGLEATFAQNNVGAPGFATLTGSEITSATGTVFLDNDRSYPLSGTEITSGIGDTFASSLAFVAGEQLNMGLQDIGPRGATLTGEEIFVEDGTLGLPSKNKDAGSIDLRKRKNSPRVIVEVGDQRFIVGSEQEARTLLELLRETAEEKAQAELDKIPNMKSSVKRSMRSISHNLNPPEIVVSGASQVAYVVQQEAEAVQAQIEQIYAEAVKSAEMALELRKKQQEEEDEEDDFVIGLML